MIYSPKHQFNSTTSFLTWCPTLWLDIWDYFSVHVSNKPLLVTNTALTILSLIFYYLCKKKCIIKYIFLSTSVKAIILLQNLFDIKDFDLWFLSIRFWNISKISLRLCRSALKHDLLILQYIHCWYNIWSYQSWM